MEQLAAQRWARQTACKCLGGPFPSRSSGDSIGGATDDLGFRSLMLITGLAMAAGLVAGWGASGERYPTEVIWDTLVNARTCP